MAIAAYNSWGELIYHLSKTDMLRSIFVLFLAIISKTLSSLCYNNAARIESLLVAGQHLLIYRAVPLTLYMVRNINVKVNVDLCFMLSCEHSGRLPNLKRWKLSTAHMPRRWRGGRQSEKYQLRRCINQRRGAQAQTHQNDVLAQWFVDITDFFPDTTIFYD